MIFTIVFTVSGLSEYTCSNGIKPFFSNSSLDLIVFQNKKYPLYQLPVTVKSNKISVNKPKNRPAYFFGSETLCNFTQTAKHQNTVNGPGFQSVPVLNS